MNKIRTVVFTNGCFDILHEGHMKLLKECKAMGDLLFLGLNTNESVKKIKGPNRPINSEQLRAHNLYETGYVDAVLFFNEDTPAELLRKVRPDILVKGSDWAIDKVVGKDFVESYGGRVELIDLVPGVSTTKIIEEQKLA